MPPPQPTSITRRRQAADEAVDMREAKRVDLVERTEFALRIHQQWAGAELGQLGRIDIGGRRSPV
jgi:hypothetical protein